MPPRVNSTALELTRHCTSYRIGDTVTTGIKVLTVVPDVPNLFSWWRDVLAFYTNVQQVPTRPMHFMLTSGHVNLQMPNGSTGIHIAAIGDPNPTIHEGIRQVARSTRVQIPRTSGARVGISLPTGEVLDILIWAGIVPPNEEQDRVEELNARTSMR